MGTGPKAERGYDLALTEILDGEHRFLVEVGSERGARGARASSRPARRRTATSTRPDAAVDGAAERMGRTLDATDLRDLLARQPRARALGRRRRALPHLRQLHARLPDLLLHDRRGHDRPRRRARRARPQSGTRASRSTTRTSTAAASGRRGRSRYRQWLTHKFGTWHDQFGSSGCVGCGRCITWCPVGIDVTEELAAHPGERGGVPMQTIDTLLQDVPLFHGLTQEALELIAGCARTSASRRARCSSARATRPTPSTSSGTAASRSRRSCPPAGRSRSRRSTPARSSAGRGSSRPTAGTSTRGRSALVRATAFDGACLRGKCETDPALGYDLMSRFAQVLIERLQWTTAPAPRRLWRRHR